MQAMSGYTQDKLDEVWDAFGTTKEQPGTKKIVDDKSEQVMTIDLPIPPSGQLQVSRKPGTKVWKEVPGMNQESDFQ